MDAPLSNNGISPFPEEASSAGTVQEEHAGVHKRTSGVQESFGTGLSGITGDLWRKDCRVEIRSKNQRPGPK